MKRSAISLFLITTVIITGCTSGNTEKMTPVWELENTYSEDPVTLRLRVDRLLITTAQFVRIEVEVDAPERMVVFLPDLAQFADSGFHIEFHTEQEVLLNDGRTRKMRRYRLVPFLAGDYLIPDMVISWLSPGGDPSVLSTGSLEVQVRSVLTGPIATTGPGRTGTQEGLPELQEVGDPVSAPPRWWRWVFAGVAALMVLATVIVVVIWRRSVVARHAVPTEAPAVVALRALDKLEHQDLLNSEIDQFYVRVSAILRAYLEAQFNLRAPEQTTEEFLAAVKAGSMFDHDHQRMLHVFLASCDAVKFARSRPSSEATKSVTDMAISFVRATVISGKSSATELAVSTTED